MSTIFTLEKIWKAYEDCKENKKNTANALAFELNKERNLVKLLQDLKSRQYKISRHICFVVTKPTPREIFAADFRDRIVHHLIYKELYRIFDKDLIEDSYANRKGKGTHPAVFKVFKNIKEIKSKLGGGYCLKLDIQSFFRSIDRGILFKLLECKIKKEALLGGECSIYDEVWQSEVLWLLQKIVFNDPTSNYVYKGSLDKLKLIPKSKSLFYSEGRGLPIGNLTSQFFANVYLNELDQFVTKVLGFEKYVRYVDDFIIISDDKEGLCSSIKIIDDFLNKNLNLKIHPNKIYLQPISSGVDYLGYFIKPAHILVRQKVAKRFKAKFYKLSLVENISKETAESALPIINSYYGHFGHAQSFNLRKNFALNDKSMIKLKTILSFDEEYRRVGLSGKDNIIFR